MSKELEALIKEDRIKEDILKVWDHAGLDAEVDARTLAKKLGTEPEIDVAGSRVGRQLQHPQIGNKFGREGVLGAVSNNVEGISVKDIATPNNVAAKKINAGLITKIVYSLVGNKSTKPLYFPVMWNPIINYFLGKLFGDRTITKEEYHKGISGQHINEDTTIRYIINKQSLIEETFKLDTPRLKAKFAYRAGKPFRNVIVNQGLLMPLAGSIIGTGIGSQIVTGEDEDGDETNLMGTGNIIGGLVGTIPLMKTIRNPEVGQKAEQRIRGIISRVSRDPIAPETTIVPRPSGYLGK
jgi:hypothetical protein